MYNSVLQHTGHWEKMWADQSRWIEQLYFPRLILNFLFCFVLICLWTAMWGAAILSHTEFGFIQCSPPGSTSEGQSPYFHLIWVHFLWKVQFWWIHVSPLVSILLLGIALETLQEPGMAWDLVSCKTTWFSVVAPQHFSWRNFSFSPVGEMRTPEHFQQQFFLLFQPIIYLDLLIFSFRFKMGKGWFEGRNDKHLFPGVGKVFWKGSCTSALHWKVLCCTCTWTPGEVHFKNQ